MNVLYCGDNLDIAREHVPHKSVDLMYGTMKEYTNDFCQPGRRLRPPADQDAA